MSGYATPGLGNGRVKETSVKATLCVVGSSLSSRIFCNRRGSATEQDLTV